MTGLERDFQAVAAAREQGGGPAYLQTDVRDYRPEPASFDAVLILSQSFGYFDPAGNRELLAPLGATLRPGGRMILDLWNPDFFRSRQGEHSFQTPFGAVRETKRLDGDRLFSCLAYPDGKRDAFEFQTFSPAQMSQMAASAGLRLTASCTDFGLETSLTPDKPKVQFLLERT